MLSYQHLYHAGNLADVHKHAMLAVMLAHMAAKPKPMSYLETHAGRGLYDLGAPEAAKTGEAAAGIARVARLGWFGADHPYAQVLTKVRALHGAGFYPGSPLLAALSLRPDDRIRLAELHPQEYAALADTMLPYDAQMRQAEGLELVLSTTPPEPKRGMLVIDPSYEVKADYATLPGWIAKLHRKWNVGVIVLWYPLLAARAHLPMLAELEALNLQDTLRHEVRFAGLKSGAIEGSGLFIVNTPYPAQAEAARLSGLFAGLK